MTDPLAFARRLIDAGVPVFAAPPGGPIGYRLPNEWQKIKADPKRLEVWRGGYALAAVCGHGLDVLDVDPRNGGHEAARALRAAGLWPREYAVVTTPSGGLHSYVASLGVAKASRDGIDVQAGAPDGSGRGFVFLPGTQRVSKATGLISAYAVARDDLDGFGQDDASGAGFLAWVQAAKPAALNGSAPGRFAVGVPIPELHQEALFQHACSMRARGVPESEAAAVIRARAEQDCVPPWSAGRNAHGGPADDPWSVVAHAYKYVEGETPDPPGLGLELVRPTPSEDDPPAERFPRIDWRALWCEPEDEDWILEPLIPARRAVALYSAPKLGKSLLMLEVAVAVSRGTPVLGIAPVQGPVLYVDFENDPRGDVRRRLRTMGLGPADLEHLHYLSYPTMSAFDSAKGGAELLERALAAGAGLVVIDTVSRTIAGEENSNDTWVAFYRNTGLRLKESGIAYVRLDHSGKDDTRGMRGGSAKSGDVDAVWQLTKPGAEDFLLHCEAARMNIPDEQRDIAFRRVTDPYLKHERIAVPSKTDEMLELRRLVWECLDDAGLPEGAGRPAARKALQGTGLTVSNDVLGEILVARRAQQHLLATRPDWAPPVVEGALRLAAIDLKRGL